MGSVLQYLLLAVAIGLGAYALTQRSAATQAQSANRMLVAELSECGTMLRSAASAMERQTDAIEQMQAEIRHWQSLADSVATEVETIRRRSLADARAVLAAEVSAEADSAMVWMIGQSYELMQRWETW